MYIKLVEARDSNFADDVAEYDSTLLGHYVLNEDEETGEWEEQESVDGEEVSIEVLTVNAGYIVQSACAIKAADGTIWIDSSLEQELFC